MDAKKLIPEIKRFYERYCTVDVNINKNKTLDILKIWLMAAESQIELLELRYEIENVITGEVFKEWNLNEKQTAFFKSINIAWRIIFLDFLFGFGFNNC